MAVETFNVAGTYTWTCPQGVTAVDVLAMESFRG